MRRNRKFDLGKFRNKLIFYKVVSVNTPHGSTVQYQELYTDFFGKETQIQRSNFAELAGASITNQDCIFYGRQNPNFAPEKDMVVFNVVDGFWYNVLSYQPLEDPAMFYRFVGQRKEASFNPDLGAT